MKTFAQLEVQLNGVSPDEFGGRAEAAAADGWARDRLKDQEMRSGGDGAWFTFTLSGHPTLPPALLFLTQRGPGVLHVSNVISPARDRLSYDEYNAILRAFGDDVLARVRQAQPAISFSLTGETVDLSTKLPRHVYQRLTAFSGAANKGTGSAHPYDRERWIDFLITTVEAGAALDGHTLGRWLVEEGGWAPEQADRLADEFDFGRELLERRRRAS